MSYQIKKEWVTQSGFKAVILLTEMGHHCGYVGLTNDHALYGKDYSEHCMALTVPSEPIGKRGIIPLVCHDGRASPDIVFDVHGSITYSGGNPDYPIKSDGLWWFGFDCGHSGDGKSPEYLTEMRQKYPGFPSMWRDDGEFRDVDYCVAECESLARQMIDRVSVKADKS
ncbi:MAG: hypothetical protein ACRCVX_03830 [Shewanella sp.]